MMSQRFNEEEQRVAIRNGKCRRDGVHEPLGVLTPVAQQGITESDLREGIQTGPLELERLVKQILVARDNRVALDRQMAAECDVSLTSKELEGLRIVATAASPEVDDLIRIIERLSGQEITPYA